MRSWWANLCLFILSLSLFPGIAHSQKAEEASQTVPNSFCRSVQSDNDVVSAR